MELAAQIGIKPMEFWDITPKELNIYATEYSKRKMEEFKEKLSLEYYNAAWTIRWLGKKSQQPQPLKKILDNLYKEKKVMSTEQMLIQAKLLNSIFGGDVVDSKD